MIYLNEVIKDLFKKEVCQQINCGSQRCDGSDEWLSGCMRYRKFKSDIKKVIKEAQDS